MRTLIEPTYDALSVRAAALVAELLRRNNAAGRPTVLGLATGATPLGFYRELIRLHQEEGLDFGLVETFNLDEYYPMEPTSPHSYRHWMTETFFSRVNLRLTHTHIPDGRVPAEEVAGHCARYEQAIRDAGGLDVQILGIGRTGHVGFNEPGSPRDSRTRLVTLHADTRRDAADGFGGEENVPRQALTMGVATILEARAILLLASGARKAEIVRQAMEGPVSEAVPATFLRGHPDVTFVLDEAAARG